MSIKVIGAGLAGCEAAHIASYLGCKVDLYEMKPVKYSPAHKSQDFAELVCSNSLKAKLLNNASGLIKDEMKLLHSLIMEAAEKSEVPAGGALAVDRNEFSKYITNVIENDPNITIHREEIVDYSKLDGIVIVATGPLTSDGLAEYIVKDFSEETLHFFDAAAPIVEASSVDKDNSFFASRYGKGEADSYLNCPMTKDEYDVFYKELINAQTAPLHSFDVDNPKVFEGCMPVEVMAKRGYDTLRFGPMKPVGLVDPKTNKEAYAVVQLRKENISADMYNLVGFQTNLTFGEQKRVFGLIPGLKNANFLRYGVMHRNTFLNSPKLLNSDFSVKTRKNLFFAGQMTGVEGYLESSSSGLVAGINAALTELGKERVIFPDDTIIGALAKYISAEGNINFQPMNANFGIIRPFDGKVKGGKRMVHEAISYRAIESMKKVADTIF